MLSPPRSPHSVGTTRSLPGRPPSMLSLTVGVGWSRDEMADRSKSESAATVPTDLRVDYGRGRLDEADVLADPVEQFGRWFNDARAANVAEPNAMTLATVDGSGAPSARVVLLKSFDARGFTF